ncbi:MAG: hydantoinase B/oxoprolinase family protein [Hyphomicrobiaceae bacterium]|nr:hydantoinase B/oxoprolinase family protein [Hyphomicrobiaceae bacterium]
MAELLDPVTLEIVWTRLISAVDEAAKVIVRTSFSTLSNEANDFACVITDANGCSLAQNTGSIPSFIGCLPATVRHFLDRMGRDRMKPGDVLITNNPWDATGHLNDITLVKPVFRGSRLVAFAASTSHVPDIGGRVRSIEPREVYEEGFHIPLMHLVREGVTDETLVKLLRTNVRTPDQTLGDVWAQASALAVIERRLLATMDDYGLETLAAFADDLFRRSEAAMRAAIRTVPSGTYRYAMRTDGLDESFEMCVAVTIDGDDATFDFTGTSPQQARAINCVWVYTFAMTAYALKCALLPNLPNNEGVLRPIKVVAPEGSLLNPKFPVSVGGRAATGHYVPALIFGALHQAIPEKVMAAPGSPLWILTLAGLGEDAKPFATVLFYNGGLGGRAAGDGVSTLSWPSNISSTPVEVAERSGRLFFHEKALKPGSGGDGERRGGLGQRIVLESLSAREMQALLVTERTKLAAPGIGGGRDGALGRVAINGADVDTRRMQLIRQGDKIVIETPGGGGYGDAARRSAAARERDRAMGYVEEDSPPRRT